MKNLVRLNYLNVIVGPSLYITLGNCVLPGRNRSWPSCMPPALTLFNSHVNRFLSGTSYMSAEETIGNRNCVGPEQHKLLIV